MIGLGFEYYIIFGVFMLLSWLVGKRLQSKFKKYSKIQLKNGLSGRDIAEKMLRDNGINDVKIISVKGHLTDHYNPTNKTVNLSPHVYGGQSIAAAAVAAHEVGHAVQHATAYSFLTMRSKLVPIVSFSSKWMQWVLMAGLGLLYFAPQFPQLLLAGIVMFSITTLFTFVTLPVEFDASNRALKWLERTNTLQGRENEGAKDALWWAAMTYVVAALSSLGTLLYYITIFMRSRR